MQKTSIVVGGTKGIGSVISDLFIERGDTTYVLSRINDNEAELHMAIDLTDSESITEAFEKLFKEVSLIDYLVFSQKNRSKENSWDNEFDLTLRSINMIINLSLNKINEYGSIVILGSPAGRFIVDEQPVEYHLSKSALEQLARYYAVKLGGKGIRVNCIMPGTIIKPENKDFFSEENLLRKLLEKVIPMKRMGFAREVADLVDFLCSDKSTYITGQSFFVDGGLSLVGQETIARNVSGLNRPESSGSL